MDSKEHYVYNENTENSIQLNNFKLLSNRVWTPNLFYIGSKKQLMIMGSFDNKNMWYYKDKEWCLFKEVMPVKLVNFDLLSPIDGLVYLFCFDHENKGIWIFDTLFNKWFKSKYCVPHIFCEFCYVLKWKNYCLHIIDFRYGTHYKVDMYCLIPSELIKKCEIRYEPLIFGYIRKFEGENMIVIPYVLKKCIFNCYPLFI